jgi:hypothetical protein
MALAHRPAKGFHGIETSAFTKILTQRRGGGEALRLVVKPEVMPGKPFAPLGLL